MRSITKSVVSLLVGIAVDRGWLKSLDTPVLSFFLEYAVLRTPDKDRITLRDLLTMTSGLEWPVPALSYANPANVQRKTGLASDQYRFVLGQPVAATPGTVWNYNSGGVEVLGDILMKVSSQPLDKLAKQALFDPLGISNREWAGYPNGKLAASWALWLRPRDLAKIGQLVLKEGTWGGRQIVSAHWIKEMTAAQVPVRRGGVAEDALTAIFGSWAVWPHASATSIGPLPMAGAGSGFMSCQASIWSSPLPPATTNSATCSTLPPTPRSTALCARRLVIDTQCRGYRDRHRSGRAAVSARADRRLIKARQSSPCPCLYGQESAAGTGR